MRSTPTIFCYDKELGVVSNRPLKICSWLFEGKGVATRKYDGIAIKVEGKKVFRRYEWREGQQSPPGFIRCEDPNPKRPHAPLPGWVPVPDTFLTNPQGTDERALSEAWNWLLSGLKQFAFNNSKKTEVVNPYAPVPVESDPEIPNGTYELCGPKIRGNNDGFKQHVLLRHGADIIPKVPRTYDGLKKFLETFEGEGLVWRYEFKGAVLLGKLKRRDFGLPWPIDKQDLEMAYRKDEPTKESVSPLKGCDETPEGYGRNPDSVYHFDNLDKSGKPFSTQDNAPSQTNTNEVCDKIFEPDNPETGDDIHLGKEVVHGMGNLVDSVPGD